MHRIFAQVWERIILLSRMSYHYYSSGFHLFESVHETDQVKGFVVFWPWRRIEVGSNCAFYDIPEGLFVMRLGVEVRKLHVRTFV